MRAQGSGGGGDGKEKDKRESRSGGQSERNRSRRNEPAEIRGLREAAKSSSGDQGVDRGRKDRPRIQRAGGVRSHADVMRERRMNVYGETRAQASRIGADDHTRSMADRAWRRGIERKMQKGTLSDFDRQQWVSDYGVVKTRAQKRADYEMSHFEKRAQSAWNNNNFVDYAKFKLQSKMAGVESGFEGLKSAPLDTLADLTRNPFVAGALSLTGVGAGGVLGLQAVDTVADVAQGEVEGDESLRTLVADTLDSTPVGDGLGIAKGIISAGIRDPEALPRLASGMIGGTVGQKAGVEVAQQVAKSNPYLAAAIPSVGSFVGKLGATRLYESSTPAKQAAEEASKTSPLVAGVPKAPQKTPKRTRKVPIGTEERAIEEQEELAQADALALVRDYQVARFSASAPDGSNTRTQASIPEPPQVPRMGSTDTQGPLPYYNTFQPYRMA